MSVSMEADNLSRRSVLRSFNLSRIRRCKASTVVDDVEQLQVATEVPGELGGRNGLCHNPCILSYHFSFYANCVKNASCANYALFGGCCHFPKTASVTAI